MGYLNGVRILATLLNRRKGIRNPQTIDFKNGSCLFAIPTLIGSAGALRQAQDTASPSRLDHMDFIQDARARGSQRADSFSPLKAVVSAGSGVGLLRPPTLALPREGREGTSVYWR
jgi:hypothetical protein